MSDEMELSEVFELSKIDSLRIVGSFTVIAIKGHEFVISYSDGDNAGPMKNRAYWYCGHWQADSLWCQLNGSAEHEYTGTKSAEQLKAFIATCIDGSYSEDENEDLDAIRENLRKYESHGLVGMVSR